MPKPPPRSISGISTPISVARRGRAARAPGGPRPRSRRSRRSGCRCGCAGRAARDRGVVHAAYGLERVTAGDREPELLVLVRSGDVLVGVRLDPGRHPDHHPRGGAELGGDGGQAVDLVEGVDDDPPDAEADGPDQLDAALVVAVEADALHREAGPLGHRQLAARADVEVQPLLGQPPDGGRRQEALAGEEDVVRRERLLEGTRARRGSRPRRGRRPGFPPAPPGRSGRRRRR